eukprot:357202-Chlamydomonas_euryale.AAC.9
MNTGQRIILYDDMWGCVEDQACLECRLSPYTQAHAWGRHGPTPWQARLGGNGSHLFGAHVGNPVDGIATVLEHF